MLAREGTGMLSYGLVGMQNDKVTLENSLVVFLKKLNIWLPSDATMLPLGGYSVERNLYFYTKMCT